MGGQITRSTLHDLGKPVAWEGQRGPPNRPRMQHTVLQLPWSTANTTPLRLGLPPSWPGPLPQLTINTSRRGELGVVERASLPVSHCPLAGTSACTSSHVLARIHSCSGPHLCTGYPGRCGFKTLPGRRVGGSGRFRGIASCSGRPQPTPDSLRIVTYFSVVFSPWALGFGCGVNPGFGSLGDRDSELVLPDCLRPRSFTALRRPSLRRDADEARLSVSLCDLNVPGAEGDEAAPAAGCPIPQNSLNSQHSRALPAQLDGDLRFHALRAGAHVRILDEQTVARLEHGRDERALVFTSRPVRVAETIFVKVTRSGGARPGALSFGVTTCDPGTLRPADLPFSPEALVDRKEFWAVCRVPGPLHSGDILGLVVNADGELHLSHNGAAAGMQLCVDASQPLWMLFGLHGAVTQIRILGSTILAERSIPSLSCSPASTPTSPSALGSRLSDPLLSMCSSGPLGSSAGGTAPNSPVSLPESPVTPGTGQWSDECTICYEHAVDTVICTCGHMCLCYACGLRLKKALHACCPICRRPIKDIIKTYRSS
ncbi:neuralized-like protein 1a [Lynx pardinus]|uniref:Neuralized-like protein 1a n=1 Tax=Lynx pardinus TaxID=191816 RepID=A0A485MTL3_LYNPA|nr:neuralized-like protein 1a [Lynx pardinus]